MKKSFILLIFIKAYLCTTEKSDYEDEYENNDSNESSEDNFYRDGDDETKEYFDETSTTIFPIPPLNSTTTTVWPNLTNSLSRTRPTPPPFNSTFKESKEEGDCDTTTSETDTTKTDDTTIPPTIFNLTTSFPNITTPSSNSTTTTESSTSSETDTTTTDMDTTTITEGGK